MPDNLSDKDFAEEVGAGCSTNAIGFVEIPKSIKYNNKPIPVTYTLPYAGSYNSLITGVSFPKSIRFIARNGFLYCSNLIHIYFNGNYTFDTNPIIIDRDAFSGLPTKLNSLTPATVYTSPTSSDNPVFDHFFRKYGDTINYSETPCFKEDTKILTDNGYVAVQDLRKGDMVKTLHDDFKAIAMICKEEIHHNSHEERNRNQLFKYSSDVYPEIFEDLVITGGHSILLDSLSKKYLKKQKKWISKTDLLIDNKYRLLAFIDEKCDIYEVDGQHTIYHFALEGDYHKNYGVYANGLLVEACSQWYLKEHSCMTLI